MEENQKMDERPGQHAQQTGATTHFKKAGFVFFLFIFFWGTGSYQYTNFDTRTVWIQNLIAMNTVICSEK